MSDTETIHLRISADQAAAIDAYLDALYQEHGLRVTHSQLIRDAVGKLLRDNGQDWPADPQLGGDRRSPKVT